MPYKYSSLKRIRTNLSLFEIIIIIVSAKPTLTPSKRISPVPVRVKDQHRVSLMNHIIGGRLENLRQSGSGGVPSRTSHKPIDEQRWQKLNLETWRCDQIIVDVDARSLQWGIDHARTSVLQAKSVHKIFKKRRWRLTADMEGFPFTPFSWCQRSGCLSHPYNKTNRMQHE